MGIPSPNPSPNPKRVLLLLSLLSPVGYIFIKIFLFYLILYNIFIHIVISFLYNYLRYHSSASRGDEDEVEGVNRRGRRRIRRRGWRRRRGRRRRGSGSMYQCALAGTIVSSITFFHCGCENGFGSTVQRNGCHVRGHRLAE